MILRYSSSFGAGALITAGLIYWMQLMISGTATVYPRSHGFPVVPAHRIIETPPRTRPEPPPRPEPQDAEPATGIELPNLPTAVSPTAGPVTPPGPPVPPSGRGGRPGLEAFDTELALLTPIAPAYPFTALKRELEGRVIVEYTVTRDGSVTNVRIIESSHREFESAAVTAVSRARYRPRVIDGAAVDVPGMRTELQFQLHD